MSIFFKFCEVKTLLSLSFCETKPRAISKGLDGTDFNWKPLFVFSVREHSAAIRTMESPMMKLKENECLTWMKSWSVRDSAVTWSNTWRVKVRLVYWNLFFIFFKTEPFVIISRALWDELMCYFFVRVYLQISCPLGVFVLFLYVYLFSRIHIWIHPEGRTQGSHYLQDYWWPWHAVRDWFH